MNAEAMYNEVILDHYRYPVNHGKLENPDVVHKEVNSLCGDVVEIQLKLNGERKVSDAKFTGSGCAISQSSVDILLGNVKGKSIGEIEELDKDFLLRLLGIEISHMRLKCALLSLMTLKVAVSKL